MQALAETNTRLTVQALALIGGASLVAGVLWMVGPLRNPTAAGVCALAFLLALSGYGLVRTGRVALAGWLTTLGLTAGSLAAVSTYWGIEGHNPVLLLPSMLVGSLLVGPRGTLVVAGILVGYVAFEGLNGPMPWATTRALRPNERMIDLMMGFTLCGVLVALISRHYHRYLEEAVTQAHAMRVAGDALKVEEAFRRELVERAPVPMVVLRERDAVEELNEAARSLLGRDLREEERLGDLLRQDDTGAWLRGPDGEIPVEVAKTTLGHVSGRRVLTLQDLRPFREVVRRQEEALRESEAASRAKSAFLANMSHELRTPMNAILGYAELLDEETDDAQTRADLGRILTSGRHLLELIDDVLDMSRVESGKVQLGSERVELGPLFGEVVSAIRVVAEKEGRSFSAQLEAEAVWGDRTRIRQILLNLLSNAVKFGDCSVVLQVETVGEQVHFDVVDDGQGVPSELAARLFEPFARGHADKPGTGLGLALSREFARRMGGDVELVPDSETRFRLRLPLPH